MLQSENRLHYRQQRQEQTLLVTVMETERQQFQPLEELLHILIYGMTLVQVLVGQLVH